MTSEWSDLRWFVVFNGIADAWLWGFDADGWRLRHGNPACGTLGVLPAKGGPVATLDDALWLADVLAYEHDAPVGVSPAMKSGSPRDTAAVPPAQPVHPFEESWGIWYWQSLNQSYAAAADLRFNGSYVIRYDEDTDPTTTDFSARFQGQEELIGMYAMAARQSDILSEYLCLYRILEARDKANGKTFSTSVLANIATADFGELRVIGDDESFSNASNAFEIYRQRAQSELSQLASEGESDIPEYLYRIRNTLAHGKQDILTSRDTDKFSRAARALPIVKLLARMAIEP